MVDEVLAFLRCRDLAAEKPDAVFIDGTLGTGGHTHSMEVARERFREERVLERVTTVLGDFREAPQLLQPYFENTKVGTDGRAITQIDGALVDAGMSLWQVTNPARGISFRGDSPLDMRYNRDQNYSAFDLVNRLSANDLEDVLFKFADERWARRIAAVVVEARQHHPIHSTSELVSLIEAAIPVAVRRQSRVHPATQTFAALRLAVNDELRAIDEGAWALLQVLAPTARLIFLTYSSNEDRTLKRTFRLMAGRAIFFEDKANRKKKGRDTSREYSKESRGRDTFASTRSSLTTSSEHQNDEPLFAIPTEHEPQVPGGVEGWNETWSAKIVTPKPVVPTDEEIAANALARSCKLRAVEKIALP
jgi:16S rRNA (cytosine1402-N4)-methyltransferase